VPLTDWLTGLLLSVNAADSAEEGWQPAKPTPKQTARLLMDYTMPTLLACLHAAHSSSLFDLLK
jgi:hypothetical protein